MKRRKSLLWVGDRDSGDWWDVSTRWLTVLAVVLMSLAIGVQVMLWLLR